MIYDQRPHVQKLLSQFHDPAKRGAGWKVKCPAHDDSHPSLDIDIGSDDRILLICRTGCRTEDIVRVLGLTMQDLFAPKQNGTHNGFHNGTGKAEKTYATAADAVAGLEQQYGPLAKYWTYHNAAAEPVGVVVRWNLLGDRKEIRPVSRHTDGRWRIKAMPTPRPLFNLTALAAAPLVTVCEGEPAADAVTSIGFTGTTSSGGAQSANQTDWSPLAGKEVWIFPDNDQPGRKYAADVVGILAKLTPTPTVKVINLPDVPDGGDMVDWVEANSQADDLKAQIEDMAAKVTAEGPPPPDPPRYRFYTSTELADTTFNPKWLIRNVLVEGEPCVGAGAEKTLKTSIIGVDLGVSIASGTPFLSCDCFSVPERRTVAIVSGESGMRTLRETAIRVCTARGLRLADLSDQLIWCPDLPLLPDVEGMNEFVGVLADRKAEVVVLDPMYLMLGDVDEKSIFRVGAMLRVVAEMLAKKGATLVLLHHANRHLQPGAVMTLRDISYAGFAAFARQYILLSRRTEYKHSGEHELWMNVGGSAGHGCLRAVDVSEGIIDDQFRGRKWEVSVYTLDETKQTNAEQRETQRIEKKAQERKKDDSAILQAIESLTNEGKVPTVTKIRDAAFLSSDRTNSALDRLLEDDIIKATTEYTTIGSGAAREVKAYRLKGWEQPSGPFGMPGGPPDGPDGYHASADHHPDSPSGGPGVKADGGASDSNPRKTKTRKKRRDRKVASDGQGVPV
jgi:hypothetical protein